MDDAETLSGNWSGTHPAPRRHSAHGFRQFDRLGRYVIVERIGMGGMGVVYAAYDPQLDRKVAVKLVRSYRDATSTARLLREAKALARLSHPNVVTVHDVGTVSDRVFVAMEYVEGQSLRNWLLAEPRPWRTVLGVMTQAGLGLVAAHEHGLVHRDFKPENVMLRPDGRVQVLDFGLVRAAPVDEAEAEFDAETSVDNLDESSAGHPIGEVLTKVGSLVGTPAYMAPEQMSGHDAGQRSDQFSFCVTLYEALYGERPHAGSTVGELARSILHGEVRPQRRGADVPRWIRTALLRGLSRCPSQRYDTMQQLLAQLSDRPTRRRRILFTAGGLLVLSLGAAATHTALDHHHTEQVTQTCHHEGERLSAIWNDDTRRVLERQFHKTHSPHAATSYKRLTQWLDPWAERWAVDRTAMCQRTHVDHAIDVAHYEQAVSCFEDQRERLSAMLSVFEQADIDMVAGATKAAARFSELESCADERSLALRPPIPLRLLDNDDLATVRHDLARISALLDSGDYAYGTELAQRVVDAAARLNWPPIEAEARIAAAGMLSELGRYAQAHAELQVAFKLASATGSDAFAAKAAIMLLRVLGYHLARPRQALQWAEVAEALLQRLDRTEGLDAAALANNMALAYDVMGDHDRSELSHQRALSLRRAVLSDDHPETGHSYANLGNVALVRGELDQALAWHRQALAVRSQGLGPGHPDVARSHSSIGRVYLARHELDEALHYFHSAHAIFEKGLGGRHRVAARILDDIGKVYLERGEPKTALRYFRRAATTQRELLGELHHETAQSTFDSALALIAMGETTKALAPIREAAIAFETQLGPNHPLLDQVHRTRATLCAAGHAPACE